MGGYAKYLGALGEQARKAGQTLMVHNHNWEFEASFVDPAYDVLLANTDPRNVEFQVDLYWSARGLGTRPARRASRRPTTSPRRLVRRLGNRAQLFHVKDMSTTIPPGLPGPDRDRRRGRDRLPVDLRREQGPVKYYVIEHDPRIDGRPSTRWVAATTGFDYLDCVMLLVLARECGVERDARGREVRPRTNARASRAPYSRSIPESSHSIESGPS